MQQTLDARASRPRGGHVAIAVEPNGRLVRTNSPLVDGNRVTALVIDVGELIDGRNHFR